MRVHTCHRAGRAAVAAALTALIVAPAGAQDRSRPLSAHAAVMEALQANPELVALRGQYEALRALPGQARYLPPPMFEAQIWGWPVTTLNPSRTDMYMFMGQQEIPGRGKRAARVLVAERDAEIERHRILVRATELVDEIRQALADIAGGRATLELFDDQAAILRDIADAATVRYAAGRAGQQDTVAAVVELARIDGERITWQAGIREAEVRLNALLGRPVQAPVEDVAVPGASVAPDAALRLALERHPWLTLARAEIAREEAELARLQGERRPDFVVGGGYMLQPGEAGAWTARAGVSWPNAPWSRGRVDAAIAAQQKRVEAARARLDAEATLVRRDVQAATVRFDAARARAALIDTTVLPRLEHAFEVAFVAYTSDRGQFSDLLDTQRLLVSTRMEAIAARTDVARAFSELERALGGPEPVMRIASPEAGEAQ